MTPAFVVFIVLEAHKHSATQKILNEMKTLEPCNGLLSRRWRLADGNDLLMHKYVRDSGHQDIGTFAEHAGDVADDPPLPVPARHVVQLRHEISDEVRLIRIEPGVPIETPRKRDKQLVTWSETISVALPLM